MFRAQRALLLVLFVPALSTAEELTDAPIVCACLQSETFVMGGVLLSGKQAASQIFEGIGVQLHWSCDRDAILIRLAAHVPRHFRKGTLAYALPFARKGVRITLFYDRLEPILEDHWHLQVAFSVMSWRTRLDMFCAELTRTPRQDSCGRVGAKGTSRPSSCTHLVSHRKTLSPFARVWCVTSSLLSEQRLSTRPQVI